MVVAIHTIGACPAPSRSLVPDGEQWYLLPATEKERRAAREYLFPASSPAWPSQRPADAFAGL